jgi:hypothetical protein
MNEELIRQVVAEFLKLGLLEKWLEEVKLEAVESFGGDTDAILQKIQNYHSSRNTLLAFQQFLESHAKSRES